MVESCRRSGEGRIFSWRAKANVKDLRIIPINDKTYCLVSWIVSAHKITLKTQLP